MQAAELPLHEAAPVLDFDIAAGSDATVVCHYVDGELRDVRVVDDEPGEVA